MTSPNENLRQEWVKYKESLTECQNRNNILAVERLKRAVCKIFMQDAIRLNPFENRDDLLFQELNNLITKYKTIITGDPVSEEVVNFFKDRVNLFEAESTGLDLRTNPIASEKSSVIENGIIFLADQVDVFFMKNSFKNLADSYEHLFRIYKSILSFVLITQSSINARKAARFTLSFIEREMTVLEACSTELLSFVPEDNEDLRGLIMQTPVGLVSLLNDFNAPSEPKEITEYSEFIKVMENETVIDFIPPDISDFKEAVLGEVNTCIDNVQKSYLKGEYKLRQLTSQDILLTSEVIITFKKTIEKLPKLSGENKDTDSQILNGIIETTNIKIESLYDSINEYRARSDEFISELNKNLFNESDSSSAVESIIETLTNNETAEDGLDEVLLLTKKNFEDKSTKSFEALLNKGAKQSLKYKKEILLFEISTFEEILTYSVSRLLDSESEEIKNSANVFTEAFDQLEVILKKNNIQMIRPVPHDLFNAKEHEVLIAEKHDEFKKGEIIKVVNAGFMQDGSIIIRANVIAAK